MSNPYEMFQTDVEAEQKGVVLDYDAFRIRVAHAGDTNKGYDKLIKARLKPYRHQIETETFSDEAYFGVLREVYAATIILGWEVKDASGNFVSGIFDTNGNNVPFNKENVVKALADVPRLFKDIIKQASNFALYRKVQLEEDAKN